MMWFHVSENAHDIPNPITDLRKPHFEYRDTRPDEPILCVAPTVWQCVISVSARKPTALYVYRVDVANPIPASIHDPRIADSDRTGEHRITKAVLADNKAKIGTEFLGQLTIDHQEMLFLKIATSHEGVTPNHNEEMAVVWQEVDGVWTMRDQGQSLKKDWQALHGTS